MELEPLENMSTKERIKQLRFRVLWSSLGMIFIVGQQEYFSFGKIADFFFWLIGGFAFLAFVASLCELPEHKRRLKKEIETIEWYKGLSDEERIERLSDEVRKQINKLCEEYNM